MTTKLICSTTVRRNQRGELEATTFIPFGYDDRELRITTGKSYRGGISSRAQVGIVTHGSGYTGFQISMGLGGGGDYSKVIVTTAVRCTEKALRSLHAQALEQAEATLAEARAKYGDPAVKRFEFDGSISTHAELTAANPSDKGLLDWIRDAAIGDNYCGCVRIEDGNPTADTLTDDVGPTIELDWWPEQQDAPKVRNIQGTLSGLPKDIAALSREEINALPVEGLAHALDPNQDDDKPAHRELDEWFGPGYFDKQQFIKG